MGPNQTIPSTTDKDESEPKDNWGLPTQDATGAGMFDAAAVLGVESGPISITYKNSKGDTKSITIQIDKDAPAIQVDSPAHNAASKDDSPDLIGSFSDGGGSGLRADSFQFYADNSNDDGDKNPIWDLRVNDSQKTTTDRGFVCVDADPPGQNPKTVQMAVTPILRLLQNALITSVTAILTRRSASSGATRSTAVKTQMAMPPTVMSTRQRMPRTSKTAI